MNNQELINKINKLDKPKYYVSCGIPLVVESLWKENVPIYINLLANNQMNAVPNFKIDKYGNTSSNVKFSSFLNYETVMEQLGIYKKYGNFGNFDDGMDYIKQKVKSGKFVNVGVSSYFIPYSRDFKSEEYLRTYASRTIGVTNHYIMISGLEHDALSVLDTTPVYQRQKLKISDFCNAWKSDSSIPELKLVKGINKIRPYTYFEVKRKKCITTNQIYDLSKKTFTNIINEYICGRKVSSEEYVIFYGTGSLEKMIRTMFDRINLKQPLNVEQTKQCITEMRISRFFLVDLYLDMCILFPNYAPFKEKLKNFYFKLNTNLMRLVIELTKRDINVDKIAKYLVKLKQLAKEEKVLLEELLEVD